MRNRIVYLSVCITLVYWLGGMMGCATSPGDARNEEMLNEDHSIFDTRLPSERSQVHPVVDLALASIQPAVQVVESEDSKVKAEVRPVASSDKQLSVTSVDRSNWSTRTVGPRVGKTRHGFIYYTDKAGLEYTHTTVNLDASPPTVMKDVLDDTQFYLLSKREWAAALIHPLKFCWDTITLPYTATVKEPFWVNTKKGK